MLSYEILRIIWWGLLCVVCIGFAITDGFDMGVGGLIRVIGKTDIERRIMINSIAPHWDGNQVWLIVAGGGMFAAWPMVYAAAFSGFYGVIFIGSAFSILSMIGTAVATLFPFVMPSSAEPNVSLTLWDGTSSQLTLQVMTIVAIITVPLILGYTVWCYYKMFIRLDEETLRKNTHFFINDKEQLWWYLSWVLGTLLACTLAIIITICYDN